MDLSSHFISTPEKQSKLPALFSHGHGASFFSNRSSWVHLICFLESAHKGPGLLSQPRLHRIAAQVHTYVQMGSAQDIMQKRFWTALNIDSTLLSLRIKGFGMHWCFRLLFFSSIKILCPEDGIMISVDKHSTILFLGWSLSLIHHHEILPTVEGFRPQYLLDIMNHLPLSPSAQQLPTSQPNSRAMSRLHTKSADWYQDPVPCQTSSHSSAQKSRGPYAQI